MAKLHMSGNVYESDSSKGAGEFARSMVAEHGDGVTISASYNGKPCYVQNGQTFVLDHRHPGADSAGLNWVSRLKGDCGDNKRYS